MNTQTALYTETQNEGNYLTGKFAQSRLLTEINSKGNKVLSAPQKITGFEIVEMFFEPVLMVFIGGESILAETLINIH